nr:Chain B, SER-PRO-GLY-GLU-GLY-PRO-SER-GLY [Human gammaherpesvirus 8]
SPGEGPSG